MNDKLSGRGVEFNVTEHCNLRCAGCNHASPHLPEGFASPDELARDLAALGAVFHAGELRLVGGEPLLHPEIVRFAEVAKDSAVADELVLITNGMLLGRTADALWELVDVIRISHYPGSYQRLDLAGFELRAREHGVRLIRDEVPSFELAMINHAIDDAELVRRIFRECKNQGEYACHTLRDGRYYKCSPAPFIPDRLARLGLPAPFDDGVPLHQPELRERLAAHLADDRPLAACGWCLGTSGPQFAHHQLDSAGLAAELREDHRPQVAATRLRLLG
jgi:hypothetical protein